MWGYLHTLSQGPQTSHLPVPSKVKNKTIPSSAEVEMEDIENRSGNLADSLPIRRPIEGNNEALKTSLISTSARNVTQVVKTHQESTTLVTVMPHKQPSHQQTFVNLS